MFGNDLTSTTTQPESYSAGALVTNSIWQWSPQLSTVSLPELGSATQLSPNAYRQGQPIVVRRQFEVSQDPQVLLKSEFKQVRYLKRPLQLDILQETDFHQWLMADTATEHHFRKLAQQWEAETVMSSDLSKKVIHPAYQRIIGMGQEVLPLLFKELETRPKHWFWALRAITGANPVKSANRGRIKLMAQDWLSWGRDHGYKW